MKIKGVLGLLLLAGCGSAAASHAPVRVRGGAGETRPFTLEAGVYSVTVEAPCEPTLLLYASAQRREGVIRDGSELRLVGGEHYIVADATCDWDVTFS